MTRNLLLFKKLRNSPCCVCGSTPSDPSHIKSRGSGGSDTIWNVVPHCRRCHSLWHSMGRDEFLKRFPKMRAKLIQLGWEIRPKEGGGIFLTHPEMFDKPIRSK